MKNDNSIKLNISAKIDLTCDSEVKSILIVGNFGGMFGNCDGGDLHLHLPGVEASQEIVNNFMWLNDKCRDAKKVFIGTISSIGEYVENMKSAAKNIGLNINEDNYIEYLVEDDSQIFGILNKVKEEMPKFDYIIQNPPYSVKIGNNRFDATIHLRMLELAFNMLNDTGKMTIIEPSTWLINLQEQLPSVKKFFIPLRNKLENHVKSIIIDNFNDEFGTMLRSVKCLSITYIDKSKLYSSINLNVCGHHTCVKSIYDCNLIGEYKMVECILNKIKNSNIKKASSRIFNDKIMNNNYYFICYARQCQLGNGYESLPDIGKRNNDVEYYTHMISPMIHNKFRNITSEIPLNTKHKSRDVLYAYTYTELYNYKHFVLSNSVPVFLCACLMITPDNHVLKYLPWLVDKQYTDQEIYDMFGFTQKEINLIEKTVRKFQYSSPFFKRYMCGPSKVSDQEVQEFCDKLDKEFPTE